MPAPIIVQSAFNRGNTGSLTVTLGTAPTAGNLLVFIVAGANVGFSTPPAGLTNIEADAGVSQTSEGTWTYQRFVQTGDGTAWTFSGANLAFYNIGVFELSGATGCIPAHGSAGSGTTLTTGTLVPAIDPNAVRFIAFDWATASSVTATTPGGWTLLSPGTWQGQTTAHQAAIFAAPATLSGVQSLTMSAAPGLSIWLDVVVDTQATTAKTSSVIRESLYAANGSLHVSGMVREVLRSTSIGAGTFAAVDGIVREVLRSTASVVPGAGIQLIESWKTYAASANIARRWVAQFGNGGVLDPGGCLVDGSVVSFCTTHIFPLNNIRIGFWFTPVSFAPTVSNSSFLHLLQGGESNTSNQTGLGCNPDGTLSVFQGPNFGGLGGVTVANGTRALAAGVAAWLELNVLFSPATAGTSRQVQAANSADWQFGPGQFTVECFVYLGANQLQAFASLFSASSFGWWLGMTAASTLGFIYSTTGSNTTTISGAWTPTLNTWYHIAVDRDASNVVRIYANGVVIATATAAVTIFASSSTLSLGNDARLTRQMLGFLDEVRITKGLARYGGAFSPPTAAFPTGGGDPNFASVTLLCHADGTDGQPTATDVSTAAHALTLVSMTLSAGQQKFGTASFNFMANGAAFGTIELRINGTPEIVLSGMNTAPSGFAWTDRVALTAGASAKHVYGGLYIGDGAQGGWLGPSTIQRLLLTADTAQKDFAPSSGASNFALLNDLDASATYVASSNLSASDLYTVDSPSYVPASIAAVQVLAEPIQNDATNIIKALTPVLKNGLSSFGTGAVVPAAAFPLVWQFEARGIAASAPDGTPWSFSNLSSTLAGMRVSPFAKGFNFRNTSGFVTDRPYCTFVTNDLYPTTRGGVTFGWNSAGTGTVAADRTTASDIYAGINCQQNTGTQRTFRVDLPSAGRYQMRLLLGDATTTQRQIYARVSDGGRTLFTIDSSVGSPFVAAGASGVDASGVNNNYAVASWAEYNTPHDITLNGTVLNITIGTPTAGLDFTCIAHLELVALDLAGTLTSEAPEMRVAGLYVEALMAPQVGGASLQPAFFIIS